MSTQEPTAPESGSEETDEERRFRIAKQRAEQLQGFYIHLIVYLVVNAGLFALNAIQRDGGGWWFYWAAAGWGIGLLVHAASLLRIFSPDWVERKAREAVDRDKQT
ncbi:MAG: 2TM domain-containing protein [Actinomycetota bacterium]